MLAPGPPGGMLVAPNTSQNRPALGGGGQVTRVARAQGTLMARRPCLGCLSYPAQSPRCGF